ncbi:hypothetical protein PHYBLDRAFT_172692 [Phycomyces blakesleeanus NRRL 1555(-)]|uniref:Uncharacterized protein n=1 Tax=Phycomyces blakesleeanus (strain ATCC 8743b / DSM 1359 / FGSC 10004 / NBRC 33097 / NRRL 1555) TaxID=763407 RepID=A0A162TPT8_PHYB8|nr:hypothetical protein PHYBLDRAFT_172692 [Phycomyces blakesleeanus NRRL 1555(-)]OAD68833.1 hypothetical protein PHYBLDRAFT_172692 [Phycomyces blakesleeanus NRRL 1555(-)]|eukprot:XP_018286873.1 hypothetical protein PHYBLDRAFT_172692 [Phycomyces blakesleeanus NRRL 1555(-)]
MDFPLYYSIFYYLSWNGVFPSGTTDIVKRKVQRQVDKYVAFNKKLFQKDTTDLLGQELLHEGIAMEVIVRVHEEGPLTVTYVNEHGTYYLAEPNYCKLSGAVNGDMLVAFHHYKSMISDIQKERAMRQFNAWLKRSNPEATVDLSVAHPSKGTMTQLWCND